MLNWVSHDLSQLQLVLHVFEEDTVANVTVSHGKSFCGCFCLGPAPFLVCFAVFECAAKRKSGWGICGSFWLRCFVCFVFVDLQFSRTIRVPVQNSFSLLTLL